MLRIAICDDEKESLDHIRTLMMSWIEHGDIPVRIYGYENGDSLIAALDDVTFDIIFLDIVMPLLNGIDTAREIRNRDKAVKIIFLTSSPEFALDSYSVKAYDYLLKPVNSSHIAEVLSQCTQASMEDPTQITLKTHFGYQTLYLYNIEYIEAQNKKVLLYLRSNNTLEVMQTFHSLEDRLTADNGFFKCHRSYLVSLPNVDHFSTTEIFTRSGRSIPIARGYRKAFQEAYFAAMFRE